MGKAEFNRELKCEKWCPAGVGGHWLRTRVRWLRKTDLLRVFKDGKLIEKPIYKVVSDPYWSTKHKCWDVKLVVFEK